MMRDIYEQPPGYTVQVTCPRCGASSAFTHLKHRDPANSKDINTGHEASIFWAILTLAVSILLLNVIIPSFNKDDFGTSQFAGILPVWTPVALALFVLVALEARRIFRLDSAVRVQTYRCRACQFRWDNSNCSD